MLYTHQQEITTQLPSITQTFDIKTLQLVELQQRHKYASSSQKHVTSKRLTSHERSLFLPSTSVLSYNTHKQSYQLKTQANDDVCPFIFLMSYGETYVTTSTLCRITSIHRKNFWTQVFHENFREHHVTLETNS